jgi:DNA (cytosine-5)-methyltransferase 1
MDDPRGNLALEFLRLADATRAKWIVWENVPGVLSSNDGRDFGSFLGGLGEIGYGFAYRVLDAQYFGVPQRRRRVFVVGYFGDWRPPAAVLLERESLRGHPAPGKETRQDTAGLAAGNLGNGGGRVASALMAKGGTGRNNADETYLAFDTTQITSAANRSDPKQGDPCHTLAAGSHAPAVSINARRQQVRRLTPKECERLQGFPDNYTRVTYRGKPAKDGPRYKAIGNSMAVPVMRWIGERIVQVEKTLPTPNR